MKYIDKTQFLRRIVAVAGLALATLVPLSAPAQQYYEPQQIAMLPPYCKHTQGYRYRIKGGDDPAEIQRWSAILGPTFHAMHHYCRGLVAVNRALYFERTERERQHEWAKSIGEFDYVIRSATPDFVLLPEIYTKKGESLVKMGRGLNAVPEFLRAIEAKPDYWPPYAYLGDLYKKAGDTTKAREWLEKGLAQSPDAKQLKSRLAELDGTKGKVKAGAEPVKEQTRKGTKPPESAEPVISKPAVPAATGKAVSEPAQETAETQPSAGR